MVLDASQRSSMACVMAAIVSSAIVPVVLFRVREDVTDFRELPF